MLAEEPASWSAVIGLVLFFAIVMFGSGLLVVEVAKRTADGRTKRNPIAGIRTSATMSSDEAWDAAHAAGRRMTVLGGWMSAIAGAASIPIALVSWQAGFSPETVVGLAIGVSAGLGTVGLLGLVVAGAVKGHRAAVAVRDGTGTAEPA